MCSSNFKNKSVCWILKCWIRKKRTVADGNTLALCFSWLEATLKMSLFFHLIFFFCEKIFISPLAWGERKLIHVFLMWGFHETNRCEVGASEVHANSHRRVFSSTEMPVRRSEHSAVWMLGLYERHSVFTCWFPQWGKNMNRCETTLAFQF